MPITQALVARPHWHCDLKHWHTSEADASACERRRVTCPVKLDKHVCGVLMQEWFADGTVMCRNGHLLEARTLV